MARSHKVEPIERFPTKARADGRFQKRINGHLYYFGRDNDRALALAEYDRVKRDLYDGRKPRIVAEPETLTLKQLANAFTEEQEKRLEAGDISPGHISDIRWAIHRFLKWITGARLVSDLGPEDFANYRRHLLSKVGGYAYNRERACIVAMFNHADECGWLAHPVRLGKGFKKVSAGDLRGGKTARMFEPATLRKLVKQSTGQLKAMILLGLNGGMGATDCSGLQRVDVRLPQKRIDTIRRKRMTLRKVPLWPETIAALRPIIAERSDDDLVFRQASGKPWVQDKETANINAVTKDFADLCNHLNIKRSRGASFGILRHVFSTLANELQDRDAVRRIMGHKLAGLDDVYVETIDWQRLKRVTDHVRSKVFSSPGSGQRRSSKRSRHAGQSSKSRRSA